MTDAQRAYGEASELFRALVAREGPTVARRTDIVRVDINLAAWHLECRTAIDNGHARTLLERTAEELRAIESLTEAEFFRQELNELRSALEHNRRVLARRDGR